MHLLAYIDPGSGSLFIQAVIATIVVLPFFVRSQIRRGIEHLRGRSHVAATSATTTAPPLNDAGSPNGETPPARP
jgi:hypothetical protein